MSRPVTSGEPTTKTNFAKDLSQDQVDKIDLLFAIDNSQSMGDKQEYLRQAIPDLIKRLVTPSCIDPNDETKVLGISHDDGVCDLGEVEFKPVHDLHIGVVSTSLGPRLGDVAFDGKGGACDPAATVGALNAHEDDHGHLLSRAGDDEHALADAPSGFLAWFPKVKENDGKAPSGGAPPIGDSAALESDFEALVGGVHQQGCGIESQLESWYRFLIQPDPYDHLALDGDRAQWVGVDAQILAERRDFLRPDSLVAVVVLTDENDSEIDVRSLGGHGYWFMSKSFKPPRATSACASNPLDPACKSCSVASNASSDPACAPNGGAYSDATDWGWDLNLRHVHMREKYGVDPQFPIDRYVNGLTSTKVPDRTGEYPTSDSAYAASNDCTNPLFAASLPDGSKLDADTLCKLPPGKRTKDLVFYAHIGGVPHELLHFAPNDAKGSALSDADWVKILGNDPERYDYGGIDPHMIESFAPRPGLPPPSAANDADPISGREWITNEGARSSFDLSVDRQYACTFPLAHPRDCTDPANKAACDCTSTGLTHDQTSPVCDPTTPTLQVRAKAYPTIRETLLAKKMGKQGIVSSICPIHVTEESPGDPLYGYRPAVSAIVDRLKEKLAHECLPQAVALEADGTAPCLVLATLTQPGDESACDPALGFSVPDATLLDEFRRRAHDDWATNGKAGADPATLPVCALRQLVGADLKKGSCKSSAQPGWCYVTGAAAGDCGQAIEFASGSPPPGVKVNLQCIEQTTAASGP